MSAVRIEVANNRILVASDGPIAGLSESVPGAYFRQREEVWSVPLDLTTCRLLRERFGNRLVIGPHLTGWAITEKAKREAAAATADAYDAQLDFLPLVAPALFGAMNSRKYQRSGVRYIVDTKGRDGRRRALLADTVGLGKSAQAIGAILESQIPGPFLIVAPKTAVQSTWVREIHKWLPNDSVITIPPGRAKRDEILNGLVNAAAASRESLMTLNRTWVVVHPFIVRTQTWFICHECGDKTKYKVGPMPELDCGHEKSRRTSISHDHNFPQLFGINWGALVADESDQILIRLSGTPNLQRRGMEMLRDLVPVGGLRLAMSGTPFRSKPHQVWSTLNWLDPVRWSGKWRWVQSYWKTGGYSGYEVSEEGFIEEREGLLLDELKDVMLRRTRDEVRGDLPDKSYPSNIDEKRDGLVAGIYLELSKEQQRIYQQMVKMGSADLDGGQVNVIGTLAELTRLKQFACAEVDLVNGEVQFRAAGNKYEWFLEFLLELGLPDRPSTKAVFVSQFTRLLNAFAAGLQRDLKLGKGRIGGITGEVSAVKRDFYIQAFEDTSNPLDIMFLNTKAGGSSITLDAADVMVIDDETFVSDEQEQVEGRIDNRMPEKRIAPRSYYYLRSLGTLEEKIAAANAEAKRRGQKMLDGRQIAKRARELM